MPDAIIADLALLPMKAAPTGDAQANNANNNVFSKEDVVVLEELSWGCNAGLRQRVSIKATLTSAGIHFCLKLLS